MRPVTLWFAWNTAEDSLTFTIPRGGLCRHIVLGVDFGVTGDAVQWAILKMSSGTLDINAISTDGEVRTDILAIINTKAGYDMPMFYQFVDVFIPDNSNLTIATDTVGGTTSSPGIAWAILWFDDSHQAAGVNLL